MNLVGLAFADSSVAVCISVPVVFFVYAVIIGTVTVFDCFFAGSEPWVGVGVFI